MASMLTTQTLSAKDRDLLRHVPLFSFLSAADFDAIAAKFESRHFRKGAVIFHQEDEPGSLFVVARGRVKNQLTARSGRQITLSFISPGGYFGPLALLDEKRRVVEAVAVEPTDLLVLANSDFQVYVRSHPDAALVLLDRYVAIARSNLHRLHDHVFLDGRARLAKTLLAYSRPGPAGQMLVKLSQAELAGLTAATPESISRWMKGFAREGLIETGTDGIRILQLESLRRYVE